jgi:hypothetical protein
MLTNGLLLYCCAYISGVFAREGAMDLLKRNASLTSRMISLASIELTFLSNFYQLNFGFRFCLLPMSNEFAAILIFAFEVRLCVHSCHKYNPRGLFANLLLVKSQVFSEKNIFRRLKFFFHLQFRQFTFNCSSSSALSCCLVFLFIPLTEAKVRILKLIHEFKVFCGNELQEIRVRQPTDKTHDIERQDTNLN